MDARENLIVEALRFAVWAAGEGIAPQDVTGPEDFLFDYSTATGDEDWDTLPDRLLADRTILHDSQNHGPTVERVTVAKTLDEWHEDDGFVVWWTWDDGRWLGEPSYIGNPLCDDWPGYHTHWTPHPAFPAAIRQLKEDRGC